MARLQDPPNTGLAVALAGRETSSAGPTCYPSRAPGRVGACCLRIGLCWLSLLASPDSTRGIANCVTCHVVDPLPASPINLGPCGTALAQQTANRMQPHGTFSTDLLCRPVSFRHHAGTEVFVMLPLDLFDEALWHG